jgi:hypothetical protein
MKKLTFALIIFSFSSCQLFEPKPESEKFYCKLNGKAWRPEKGSYSLGTPLKAEWNKKGRFTIYAYDTKELINFSLIVDSKGIQVKEYKLSSIKGKGESVGFYYYDYTISSQNRDELTSNDGFVNITKVENKQVSGTFEFTTHSNIQNKDYKITKGQFNNLYYSEF